MSFSTCIINADRIEIALDPFSTYHITLKGERETHNVMVNCELGSELDLILRDLVEFNQRQRAELAAIPDEPATVCDDCGVAHE